LGGAPVQHREVQAYESSLFLSYFQNQIIVMEGGIESGFKHVAPETYRARLLHLKGIKKIRVSEVEVSYKSLNSGDVFLLDKGLQVYQWNGKEAGPMEKLHGAKLSKAIQDERKGLVKVHVLEEGKRTPESDEFFKFLGGEGTIKSAAEGGSDKDVDRQGNAIRRLYRLSDSSGKLDFKLDTEGEKVTRDRFDTNDVFILDSGFEVFAWIGKKASVQEKSKSLQYAQDYLVKFNRPVHLPISRILEGGENEVFESLFV